MHLPLSASRKTSDSSFLRDVRVFFSLGVMLHIGLLAFSRIVDISPLKVAFCPWWLSLTHICSVAAMKSSTGISFGVIAKFAPRLSTLISSSVKTLFE